MTSRKIIKYPSPSLRWACRPVAFPLSEEALEHIRDLRDTLSGRDDALAVASNQITEKGWRVFVDKYQTFINPEWEPEKSDVPVLGEEGCLSFPGIVVGIKRFGTVLGKWQDESGERHEEVFVGLLAREFQHECDHLEGRLFVDFLTGAQRSEIYRISVKDRKEGK